MKQELMQIVKQGQIDQETARRLAACLDFEFGSTSIRCFSARKVIVVAGTDEFLSIRILGFNEYFKGRQLICSNMDNPENLEVNLAECEIVFQSAKDPDILYINGGQTIITGLKYSDVAKDLDTSAEIMKLLPRKDPDIVQIDNRVFRQTGTVHISGQFYVVSLER